MPSVEANPRRFAISMIAFTVSVFAVGVITTLLAIGERENVTVVAKSADRMPIEVRHD